MPFIYKLKRVRLSVSPCLIPTSLGQASVVVVLVAVVVLGWCVCVVLVVVVVVVAAAATVAAYFSMYLDTIMDNKNNDLNKQSYTRPRPMGWKLSQYRIT